MGATAEGLGDLVEQQCKGTLNMFDDPLLAADETVRAKRPDVLHITNAIAEALHKLAAITATVKSGLDAAKERAAKEAETAAADAKNKDNIYANAVKAADLVKPKGAEAGGSTSSSSTGGGKQTPLEAAMAKPIAERNGEELVLAGRAGEQRKTETAAADLDLANV